MRFWRNAAFVHSSRSYRSLSRTFCSELSLGGAARARGAAIITTAARQPGSNFGMVVLSVCACVWTRQTRWQYRFGENAAGSIHHRSVNHCQAAADAQHLAGDVIRTAAQKEHDRLGDFLGLRDATKWDHPGQGFAHALGLALEERRVGRTGADAIDVDAIARHLTRQRLGECDDAALRRSVDRLAHAADPAGIARNIDDLALLRGDHRRQDCPAEAYRAKQVDRDGALPHP